MAHLNPKFVAVDKDRLFYGLYKYCLGFTLPEANVLRSLSHEWIDARLDQRIAWRETARRRWRSGLGNEFCEITSETRADLHQFCEVLTESDFDYKLVVSSHFGWVYTNDIELIDQLDSLLCLSNKAYTQAVINRPKNTVLLKKSPYQNRSYFYNLKLSDAEKQNLVNFFTNQKEHIRISPALDKWLYNLPYKRTQDYFFIDYSGGQWMTMLSLIRPGLIRRTLDIINK